MDENPANKPQEERRQKFSDYFYNGVTYVGVFLSLLTFVVELFLFAFDFMGDGHNVYLGIFTYVLFPVCLISGLILIPIGALNKWNRVRKGLAPRKPRTFFIDPALPTHRNAIFVFSIGTALLLIMSGIGSYQAFHYTESVQFCGMTCHHIMKPEHTAYTQSPHSRVKCVECHVGDGADWYVHYKLNGVKQLYHTIKGDWPTPIPTPVKNLRPADQTCEQCHSPDKFYSSFELNRTYYSTQVPEEPKWLMRMLINVGRNDKTQEGIHAHMYLDNDIYYAAEDEKRQQISWIKSADKQGNETIFVTPGSKWENQAPPQELVRKMDCVDCHNRPTHQFRAPQTLMNQALSMGRIDETLPSIKAKAIELLSGDYKTEEEAVTTIRKKLIEFYQGELAENFPQYQDKVTQAADTVVTIYKNNMFPEMKARWDAYPDNIGHMNSQGCFRCHDGQHVAQNESKAVITRDCNVCHVIIEQGPPDALQKDTAGVPFVHPFEDDGLWQEMNCTDCHTGN